MPCLTGNLDWSCRQAAVSGRPRMKPLAAPPDSTVRPVLEPYCEAGRELTARPLAPVLRLSAPAGRRKNPAVGRHPMTSFCRPAVGTHLLPLPILDNCESRCMSTITCYVYSVGFLTLNYRLVTLRAGTRFGCPHARLRDALDDPTKGHP